MATKTESNVTPLPAPSPALTDAMMPAKPMIRRVLSEIEDNFDEERGQYLNGMSDKKIAEKFNLAWAIVAKVREEYGIKIKIDPEIGALRRDLASLEEMVADVKKRLERLELAHAR